MLKDYLDFVCHLGIDLLDRKKLVIICHTKPSHLMDPVACTQFVSEFVALIHFIGDGKANVGNSGGMGGNRGISKDLDAKVFP